MVSRRNNASTSCGTTMILHMGPYNACNPKAQMDPQMNEANTLRLTVSRTFSFVSASLL